MNNGPKKWTKNDPHEQVKDLQWTLNEQSVNFSTKWTKMEDINQLKLHEIATKLVEIRMKWDRKQKNLLKLSKVWRDKQM